MPTRTIRCRRRSMRFAVRQRKPSASHAEPARRHTFWKAARLSTSPVGRRKSQTSAIAKCANEPTLGHQCQGVIRTIRSFCLQDFPLRRIGFPNRRAEKNLPQYVPGEIRLGDPGSYAKLRSWRARPGSGQRAARRPSGNDGREGGGSKLFHISERANTGFHLTPPDSPARSVACLVSSQLS